MALAALAGLAIYLFSALSDAECVVPPDGREAAVAGVVEPGLLTASPAVEG
ncbi:MAG: hypothetical protein GXO15_00400 [Crenarchaeota archaeon]|nr:hypothetical protein [Thermoproteota archaeon]